MPRFNFIKKYFGKIHARKTGKSGFFMIELIVAIFIFSTVMTMAIGALVNALDADRKTQSLESVLDNLNIVLDTMTKNMAVGTHYRCGSANANPPTPQDCNVVDSSGGNEVSFLLNEDAGHDGIANDVVTYTFTAGVGDASGYISRTLALDGGLTGTPVRMTAPEVNITNMKFFVIGSEPETSGDFDQPKIQIFIKGETSAGPRNEPNVFRVQTLVTQRIPDFE